MTDVNNLTVILAVDYAAIELRTLAEMSNDPLLISQFNAKPVAGKPWLTDVHCLIGHELTGWDPQKIKEDPDLRRSIKGFNFALVYGVSKDSMYGHLQAQGALITKKQAALFYDRFFKRYTGVKDFMERMRTQADTKGFVETLFGFRRDIYKDDEQRKTFWANQSVNSPIQSTAHTLVLIAMAMLHMRPKEYYLLQTPVIEKHDALDFFVQLKDLVAAYQKAIYLLQTAVRDYTMSHFNYKFRVPLVAEAKAGFTWGAMVDYEGQPITEFLPLWHKKYHEINNQFSYRHELEPRVKGRKHDWVPGDKKGTMKCSQCQTWIDEKSLPTYSESACFRPNP